MPRIWAAMKFTHSDGVTYNMDDPLTLPRGTDEEKAEFDRLQEYGMITSQRPVAAKDTEETEQQRTSRPRRTD